MTPALKLLHPPTPKRKVLPGLQSSHIRRQEQVRGLRELQLLHRILSTPEQGHSTEATCRAGFGWGSFGRVRGPRPTRTPRERRKGPIRLESFNW